jgi:hypothetical protein
MMTNEMKWWKLARGTALALVLACGMTALTGCESDDDDSVDLQPPAADLSGTWEAYSTDNAEPGNAYFILQLTQDGNSLSGLVGDDPVSGTISGIVVDLIVSDTEEGYSTAVTGSLHPDNYNLMAGTWSDITGSGTWRARR